MIAAKASPVKTSDRRRARRRQPAQGTTCQLATGAGEKIGLGLVWNISTSGVSMLLAAPLQPGSQVQGELMAADGRTMLGMSLKVAHLYPLRTGDYFLGGQFERPLTAQDLRPFLGEVTGA